MEEVDPMCLSPESDFTRLWAFWRFFYIFQNSNLNIFNSFVVQRIEVLWNRFLICIACNIPKMTLESILDSTGGLSHILDVTCSTGDAIDEI